MKEIDVEQLGSLASYNVPFGNREFSPAINKEKNKGYSIRILQSTYRNRNGSKSVEWEYFNTDSNGVIIESPRGLAKMYNKKVKIKDIESKYEEYKNKKVNHV